MKRRLACILLAALLLLGLCCTAFAEAPAATEPQLWNITDTVGLLTSDEDLTLEARAEEISAQYGVGIYLLILEDYSEYYDDPYETAYELYHQNTLGMGEDRDGVILLMSMSDRKYATFFYGPKAEYAFDATAATIVSGAMAERTKFISYCIYSAVISAIVYPISGHWIWGQNKL